MGTWGVHSFDNDDAVEWAAAYRNMGLDVAASTLSVAINDHVSDSLDAGTTCRGIAAVEAVAFALGRGSAEAKKHFEGAPDANVAAAQALVSDADQMIMCATGGSELSILWSDAGAGEKDKWVASLTELRARVNGSAASSADDAAPVEKATPVEIAAEDMLEGIRKAIGGLEYDIQVLRQEMNENFARLEKRVEELGR